MDNYRGLSQQEIIDKINICKCGDIIEILLIKSEFKQYDLQQFIVAGELRELIYKNNKYKTGFSAIAYPHYIKDNLEEILIDEFPIYDERNSSIFIVSANNISIVRDINRGDRTKCYEFGFINNKQIIGTKEGITPQFLSEFTNGIIANIKYIKNIDL